jgi:hypothetical protein
MRYACAGAVRLALIALVAAGCAVEPLDGPEGVFCESQRVIPVRPLIENHLLLVFDRTPTSDGLADHLETNLRRFGNVLENVEGAPDFRVAAISSDLGAGGREVLGCSGDGDGARFLAAPSDDGQFLRQDRLPSWMCPADQAPCTSRNFDGELADAMAALVPEPGTCTIRQPLEAARRALSSPEAQPLLEPGAILGVVFLGDGDDCSAADPRLFDPAATDLGPLDGFRCVEHGVLCQGDPIDRTPGFHSDCEPRTDSLLVDPARAAGVLKAMKDNPNHVVIGVASGPEEPFQIIDGDNGPALAPSCQRGSIAAQPAVRLRAAARALPQRHTITSMCNDDLSDVLTLLASRFPRVVGNPCLEPDVDPTDVDPAPGIQPACAVATRDAMTGQEQSVPPCSIGADGRPLANTELPCWWAEPTVSCPESPGMLSVQIARAQPPSRPTYDVFRCEATCPADP